MAFADTADLFLYSTLTPGEWATLSIEPEANNEGWDTCTVVLLAMFLEHQTASAIAQMFPIGFQLIEGQTFWVTNVKPKCVGGNVWKCEIRLAGLVAERPIKVRVSSSAEQQMGENIVTAFGTKAKLQSDDAVPTVEISYISFEAPPTEHIGEQGYGTPAYTPAVRASYWSSLANPLYHLPFGWALKGIDEDQLVGTTARLVTEKWAYSYEMSPG